MENLKSQVKFIHEIETQEILEVAKKKAQQIISDAKEKAETKKNQKLAKISEELNEKEQMDLALTERDSKNKLLNLKYHLYEEAISKSENYLKTFIRKNQAKYASSLNNLIIEATMRLNKNEFEILLNSRDAELVEADLKQLESKISSLKGEQIKIRVSKETLNAMGGVIARTIDKKQIYNNTLETRLAKFTAESGQKIMETLFEGAKQ